MMMMMQYDKMFDVFVVYLLEQFEDMFGEVFVGVDMMQFWMVEFEKYFYVIYFFNGGCEVEFDGEIWNIVESFDVLIYDFQFEMFVVEFIDMVIDIIEFDDLNVMVFNYVNFDMVGYIGDYGVVIEVVEVVDEQFGWFVECVCVCGGYVCIIVDYGNVDDMGIEDDLYMVYMFNFVLFVYFVVDCDDEVVVENDVEVEQDEVDFDYLFLGGWIVCEGGLLCDIVLIIFEFVGVDQLFVMIGELLLDQNKMLLFVY